MMFREHNLYKCLLITYVLLYYFFCSIDYIFILQRIKQILEHNTKKKVIILFRVIRSLTIINSIIIRLNVFNIIFSTIFFIFFLLKTAKDPVVLSMYIS